MNSENTIPTLGKSQSFRYGTACAIDGGSTGYFRGTRLKHLRDLYPPIVFSLALIASFVIGSRDLPTSFEKEAQASQARTEVVAYQGQLR